jgi:CheY-like chemotaxis protein
MAKEILIADSDKAVQEEFRKILGTSDYHLIFPESGEDALLRVKLFKPDLIIAAGALSEKSGYELCQAIKGDPGFRSIPFILLLDEVEEISDEDRKHLNPDGILRKPLQERNVRDMVDRLLKNSKAKGERISGKKMELETFGDMGEERFESSDSGGEEEQEVIDLFEVVEEPESKISIDDFVVPEKAEPFGEMTSLDSWEKLGEEEKIAAEEGFTLSLEGVEEEPKDLPFKKKQEVSPQKEAEEDVFEKIELEDILEKVGKIELPSEGKEPSERELKAFGEEHVPAREREERPFDFEEFATALKKGVEAEFPREEPPKEEALQPFSFEEIKDETPEERTTPEIPIEERAISLEEEEFPEELLEDRLEEEVLQEEGLREEELKEEELKEEKLFEEEELLGEGELPEEELLEEEKPLEEEALEVGREPEEEEIDLFEELKASKLSGEEQRIIEEAATMRGQKAEAIKAPRVFDKGFPPSLGRMDEHVEEVISEKVQGMLEDLISRHVPEMTKDLIHLTVERLEKMVREIVPELAEKMIEEEIKRLEKGEKE